MVYFERAVCIVAKIWGHAWGQRKLDLDSLIDLSRKVIRVFYRSSEEERKWTTWYYARVLRTDLYKRLITAVSQYGQDALLKLRDIFVEEWSKPEFNQYWTLNIIRKAILAFKNHDVHNGWARENLIALETRMAKELTHQERIKEYCELSASLLGLTPAAVVSFFQGEEVPGNYERQQRKYQSNR